MSTVTAAALSLLVLSAGGTLPALALARARLVAIPLAPLAGAVLASLSVTAMTAVGGTVVIWFVVLSVLGAGGAVLWWWYRPAAAPWASSEHRRPAHLVCLLAAIVGLVAAVFGLSALKAPMTGLDARTIWLLHPVWYLQGHSATVAALRNPEYLFSHPRYPPLVGGVVALAWKVAGVESTRLAVVMVALMNMLAIFGAAIGMVELARQLIRSTDDRRRRASLQGAGIVTAAVLMVVTFSVAGAFDANGYADVLWSMAAVGAVTYGLMLPCEAANVGAAVILAAAAGVTKMEGSITAAVIIGLVAARLMHHHRSSNRLAAGLRAGALLAVSTWLVIGLWPLVIRLLGALPNVPNIGSRTNDDVTRLHASLVGAWGELHVLAVAAPVALVGWLCLRRERKAEGLGTDLWAWAALVAGLAVVLVAYVVGPGYVYGWIDTSIARTTMFPALEGWWIVATWALIAGSEVGRIGAVPSLHAPLQPSEVGANAWVSGVGSE